MDTLAVTFGTKKEWIQLFKGSSRLFLIFYTSQWTFVIPMYSSFTPTDVTSMSRLWIKLLQHDVQTRVFSSQKSFQGYQRVKSTFVSPPLVVEHATQIYQFVLDALSLTILTHYQCTTIVRLNLLTMCLHSGLKTTTLQHKKKLLSMKSSSL